MPRNTPPLFPEIGLPRDAFRGSQISGGLAPRHALPSKTRSISLTSQPQMWWSVQRVESRRLRCSHDARHVARTYQRAPSWRCRIASERSVDRERVLVVHMQISTRGSSIAVTAAAQQTLHVEVDSAWRYAPTDSIPTSARSDPYHRWPDRWSPGAGHPGLTAARMHRAARPSCGLSGLSRRRIGWRREARRRHLAPWTPR
jgi:hypothetical protein